MSLTVDFKPASQATLRLMETLGITEVPQSQTEASQMIYNKQVQLATRIPTKAQTAAVYAIGTNPETKARMTSWVGRDLPGIRHREISFQIELLNHLAKMELATTQAEVNSHAVALISCVKTRLTKSVKGAEPVKFSTPEAEDAPI